MNIKLKYVITFCLIAIACSNAQTPRVISISPSFNEISSDINPTIGAAFDIEMDSSSFNRISFSVFGERSGYHSGDINYNSSTRTATFQSKEIYNSGERVTVSLSNHIKSMQGDSLTGFSWVFRIPAGVAPVYFSEAVAYQGGGEFMQVVDINNDSYADIATSSGVILLNDGTGVFNQYWFIPDCDDFYPLVVDDFNRDGLMDVFYTGSDGIKIGIGDGKGNFNITTKPFWFYEYCSSDLNGDGFPDIAGINGVTYIPPDSTTLNWGIALNDGAGNFIDTTMFRIVGGGRPVRIIPTDLDNDGDFDVVIASEYEVNPNGIFGLVGIIVGKNDGSGKQYDYSLYSGIGYPYYLYSSDFNNDHFNDIAVIASADGVVELNSGDGTFSFDTSSTRGFWSAELVAPMIGGDINGDGWIDLVVSGYWWPPENPLPYFSVRINNNSYFSGPGSKSFKDTLPDAYIEATAIADINMDDRVDIVHCSGYGTYITFNTDSVTNVKEKNNPVTYFNISDNYPNPFNSTTVIRFTIPESDYVLLEIYNSLGEKIKTLIDKFTNAGDHSMQFEANNLASGVYFYVLRTSVHIQTKKMLLTR